MDYGLKYKAGFIDISGCEWAFLIYKKGYVGAALVRPLGGYPTLKSDDGGAIKGTSLEFTLEAVADGELQEFYTTDNKSFRVEVFRAGNLFWMGFLLPELYSENYIAPPYDVKLLATDGIGILKDVPFDMASPKATLAEVIDFCCRKTGMELSYLYVSSLKELRQSGDLMYAEISIDTKTFENCTCYEVLEKLMASTDAYITELDGRWFVGRYCDLGGRAFFYEPRTKTVAPAPDSGFITIGSASTSEVYPVGELSMAIVPAKKSVKFLTGFGTYPSMLNNYDFSNGLTGWAIPDPVNANIHPVTVYGKEGVYEAVLMPFATAYQTGNKYPAGYIQQSCRVKNTGLSVAVAFECAIGESRDKIEVQGQKIFLIVHLLGDNSENYYLTRDGWVTVEKEVDISMNLSEFKYFREMGYDQAGVWSDSLEEFKIVADGFPVTGVVTLRIRNGCSLLITSTGQLAGGNVFIKNASLSAYVESGVEINVGLCPSASASGEDVSVPIVDAPVGENIEGAFFNVMWLGGLPTEAWTCDGIVSSSFLDTTIKSVCSRIGVARMELSGTIGGLVPSGRLLRDKYSGKLFFHQSYEYNLYENEVSSSLLELVRANEHGAGEIIIENVRTTGAEDRASSKDEFRSYELNGEVITKNAKMIRNLESAPEECVTDDTEIEVDSAINEKSKRLNFGQFRDWFMKKFFPVLSGNNAFVGNQSFDGDVDISGTLVSENIRVSGTHTIGNVVIHAVKDLFRTVFSLSEVSGDGGVELRTDGVRTAKVTVKELSTPEFVSGMLGSGSRLKDDHLEVDEITVRRRMNVRELMIEMVKSIGGTLIVSAGAMKTTAVEDGGSYFKCLFDNGGGAIENPLIVDDQVLCQTFSGSKIKRYWRRVTSVGADYFNLSKTDCETGSADPEAGDEVVQLGNRTDTTRQSASILCAVGADAPYYDNYSGINSFDLSGKLVTREGNLTGIVDEVFGQLSDSGLYGKNVYLRGRLALSSGKTVDSALSEVDTKSENAKSTAESAQQVANNAAGEVSKTNAELTKVTNNVQVLADAQTGFSVSVSEVREKVDNLQIGGVNIYVDKLGSSDFTITSVPGAGYTTRPALDFSAENKKRLRGKYLTVSFDYELVEAKITGVAGFEFKIKYTDGTTTAVIANIVTIYPNKTSVSERYAKTIKVEDKEIDGGITWQPHMYIKTSEGVAKVGRPAFYIGEKDLGWVENPDLLKKQTEAIAQAKADLAKEQANTYADGIVTEAEQAAIDEAQRRLDALQIGGVNLLDNSKVQFNVVSAAVPILHTNITLKSDKVYTFTAQCSGAVLVRIGRYSPTYFASIEFIATDVQTVKSVTFTPTQDIDNVFIEGFIWTGAGNEKKFCEWLMLVEGNKSPVTWSPSIFDQQKEINYGKLFLRGTGVNRNAPNQFIINNNGNNLAKLGRGLNLITIKRSDLSIVENINYDTHGNAENQIASLSNKLDNLNSDVIVTLTSYDSAFYVVNDNITLLTAIARCGGSGSVDIGSRVPYAFVGIPGIGKGNGIEVMTTAAPDAPSAEISTQIINGIPSGMNGVAVSAITAVRTELTTAINQTKDLIEFRATKEEFNAVGERVSTAEGRITTMAGDISWFVKKNDLISEINLRPEGIRINANKIEITGATVFRDGGGNVVNIFGSGSDVFNINDAFKVDKDGKATMSGAEVEGKITGTSGVIGGFTIGSDYLTKDGLRLSGGSISYMANSVNVQIGLYGISNGNLNDVCNLYIENNLPSTGATAQSCARFRSLNTDIILGSRSDAITAIGNVRFSGGSYYLEGLPKVTNTNGWDRVLVNLSTGQLAYG